MLGHSYTGSEYIIYAVRDGACVAELKALSYSIERTRQSGLAGSFIASRNEYRGLVERNIDTNSIEEVEPAEIPTFDIFIFQRPGNHPFEYWLIRDVEVLNYGSGVDTTSIHNYATGEDDIYPLPELQFTYISRQNPVIVASSSEQEEERRFDY